MMARIAEGAFCHFEPACVAGRPRPKPLGVSLNGLQRVQFRFCRNVKSEVPITHFSNCFSHKVLTHKSDPLLLAARFAAYG
jgi:hypothetical protein